MITITALNTGILKFLLRCLILFIISSGSLYAQKIPTIGVTKLLQAAANFQKAKPMEKVYLHTDKDLYFAGDTLWFKAYVLDATYFSASDKSKLLFIELHDDSTDIIRRVSVVIKNGIGNAQIPLNRNAFHEGGYTIKAYTNWMQNFGSTSAFSKRFYIGKIAKDSWLASSTIDLKTINGKEQLTGEVSLKDLDRMPVGLRNLNVMVIDSNRVLLDKNLQTSLDGKFNLQTPLPDSRRISNLRVEILDLRKDGTKQRLQIPLFLNRVGKIDLQFLPESAQLVAGVTGVVGFKAVSESGAGVNVSGVVVDSKGKEVAVFESLHKGMGSFRFKPVLGEKYLAKLTDPIGSEITYKLPLVRPSGTTILVENEEQSDSISVSINATAHLIFKKHLFYLVGSARGLVCYARPIILNSPKVIKISKRLFPGGIARILLLKEKVAINERSVFIDHHDNLLIAITAAKPFYKLRDSISVELEVKDKLGKPVVGSFSLSVTDDGQVLPDKIGNHGIDLSLLLNSNLKGMIEDPGFYLNRTTPIAWKALDNLLLTQGWVGYEWKAAFQPFAPPMFDSITVSKTRWNYEQHMEFPIVKHYQLKPWFLEGPQKKMLYPKDALSTSGKQIIASKNLLNEVTITAKKQWKGIGFADIVLDSNDMKFSGAQNLYELLRQKLTGLTIESTFMTGTGRRYMLKWQGRAILFTGSDNREPNMLTKYSRETKNEIKEFWMNWHISSLPMIEIMYSDQYIEKFIPHKPTRSFNPGERALLLKAYAEAGMTMPNENDPKPTVVRITYGNNLPSSGFHNTLSIVSPQKYYQPKYLPEFEEVKNQRATVHWEPNIITNKDGKAKVSFYATDEVGSYSINVQGADLMGKFGGSNFSLKVEK
ncbi:MAG: hypothetical protein H7223_00935 [Pedobacter sp.]|nr:hypothetical protein [Pedobacter sp.]